MSFTLTSDSLTVRILSKGARLVALHMRGLDRSLVLAVKNDAQMPDYAGAIVGPVANRISKGLMPVDGTVYQMPLNEEGRACLHSGADGLHARDWEEVDHGATHLCLRAVLADGEQGLPGLRRITARYSLDAQCLRLEITAQSDQPTPMNIAHHPYWNLGGKDVAEHQLHIPAQLYLPTDAHNLPTGQIASVSGSMFDFTSAKPVPLSRDLDVNYCIDTIKDGPSRLCATLTGPNGTRLRVMSNAPGIQVYAGGFLPHWPGALQDGTDLRPFAGLALEPQFWPDAPRHPTFPSIILRPGQIWRQVTSYHLTAPA
ncbi:galactose mutarotase [Sulfitobacter sp. F26204]|uniref:aldose epimerase family protein n=1 Tax=Sulfitobacter sp. F26204 TaxID=2996014 RepID=UPI00225E34B2|nr:aldose epimerase family protein [Sulfitobacter sp. F26204]MCX7559609.1 galactose mutarotase [Sulfitobacter sp. F26204]